MLNYKQTYALDQMKVGKNIFLTGPGGVGKTLLIKTFADWVKTKKFPLKKNPVAITSTTGASALLLEGTTLHSFAGIGLGKGTVEEMFEKISGKFFQKRRWMQTKVLIIDEISMLDPEILTKVEHIARLIKRNEKVFGGIQVILSGDFCQLPPVKISQFCFEADIWNKIVDESIYLKVIVRQDNVQFQKCLNEIRIGECSEESRKLLESRVGVKLENDLNIKPTLLYSKNIKVDAINEKHLNDLLDSGAENYVLQFEKEIVGATEETFKPYLYPIAEKLVSDTPAEQEIHLAVGSQVMLTVNMPKLGIMNGSRGVIDHFVNRVPYVRFLDGRIFPIGQHTWELDLTGEIKIHVKQIPLRLSDSITMHKSQGQTIDYVRTSIDKDIFEYGQAYTTLSRCRNLDGLTLDKFEVEVIKCNPKVKEFYIKLETKVNKTIGDYF
jgi:ATP-dependent DNA helicase PIF1